MIPNGGDDHLHKKYYHCTQGIGFDTGQKEVPLTLKLKCKSDTNTSHLNNDNYFNSSSDFLFEAGDNDFGDQLNTIDFGISDFFTNFSEEDIFVFNDTEPVVDLTKTSQPTLKSCQVDKRPPTQALRDREQLNQFLNTAFNCGKKKITIGEKKTIFNYIREKNNKKPHHKKTIKQLTRDDYRKSESIDKRLMEIGDLLLQCFNNQSDYFECFKLVLQDPSNRKMISI